MSSSKLIILFGINIALAYLVANYQKANGYSFSKSFIGALIGLVGLSLLAYKAWTSL